jgi:hypothetical protein
MRMEGDYFEVMVANRLTLSQPLPTWQYKSRKLWITLIYIHCQSVQVNMISVRNLSLHFTE